MAIYEKSLEYESIAYLSYQKKAELIKLENELKLNRRTVYYHESKYLESFITQKEENLQKLLKMQISNLMGFITMMKSICMKMELKQLDYPL